MRFHAPYMEWAKKRPSATYDLAGSNVLACTIDDLAGARDALTLSGNSDNGYTPLVAAIADRYGVQPEQIATANEYAMSVSGRVGIDNRRSPRSHRVYPE